MVRLVECRANEIGHAGIHDGKIARGTVFHIQHTCDKRAALPHYGTAKLEVKFLPWAQFQVLLESIEVSLEIGNGIGIGIGIVDADWHSRCPSHHPH